LFSAHAHHKILAYTATKHQVAPVIQTYDEVISLILGLNGVQCYEFNWMILSYIFEADQRWPCKATQGQRQSRKAKAKV